MGNSDNLNDTSAQQFMSNSFAPVYSEDTWLSLGHIIQDKIDALINTNKPEAKKNSVRVFPSITQAIYEISIELHLLYSHKMKFVHQLGLGGHADVAKLFLIRQGLRPQAFKKDLDGISSKSHLLALLDIQDSLTAENYSDMSILSDVESLTRIFIDYNGVNFKENISKLLATDIYVVNWSGEVCVCVLGSRYKNLKHFISPGMDWSSVSTNQRMVTENPSWVKAIEAKSIAGSKALLSEDIKRNYDRALIYWDDIDAFALKQILVSKGVSADSISIVNSNVCKGNKVLNAFVERGYTPEQYRGLMILSAELSAVGNFEKLLQESYFDLANISKFSVK